MLERISERVVRTQLERLQRGSVRLHFAGATTTYGGSDGPSATISVHDASFFSAIALGGHVGAAEAFAEGAWTTDDLTQVVRVLVQNREVLDDLETGFARLVQPARALAHALNRNSRAGSKRNIVAHYDLGNEFFKQFLDETMTYSAGIFEHPGASMREASEAKYDRLCAKLDLTPADHVIEIGTGWGGFAVHAASRYGCRVTTTTISNEQFRLATQRVRDAGLSDRVTVLDTDYRELTGQYDKLVSIEMIEAVGHQYFKTYFKKCADLLKPTGVAAIQAITIQDRFYESARREVDFIKRYIFPGSCIPSVPVLASASGGTDMRLVHLEDMTPHYAETLRRWRDRFLENWPVIAESGFDEEFRRIWEFYFAYCEGGFDEAVINSVQLVWAKPQAIGAFIGTPNREVIRETVSVA